MTYATLLYEVDQWVATITLNRPRRPRENTCDDYQRTYSYFPAVGKPIIGAINGAAIGLGMIVSLYCDIRIASDEARFGTAFAQLGLIAEYGIG